MPASTTRRKAVKLLLAATVAGVAHAAATAAPEWYARCVFHPWQRVRAAALGWVPVSVGDVLYLLAVLALTIAVARWIAFVWRFKQEKSALLRSVISTATIAAVAYTFFVVGWGGTYARPRLAQRWALAVDTLTPRDTLLLRYDRMLISRLNALAGFYKPWPLNAVEPEARALFAQHTDAASGSLGAKPSLLGYALFYMGTDGYYNPWTGEAQVNRLLPAVSLPFVTAHELAHQAGVAAEGDANLVAYTLCTRSIDPTFQYSGYFHLWLYAHSGVRRNDSLLAKRLEAGIHPLVLRHRDELRALRRRYRGPLDDFTGAFYDRYLRANRHPEGIAAYGQVVLTAWALEQRGGRERLRIR